MAKEAYVGVNGLARHVKNMYVGVDGVARKVKKAYVGVNGVARLFYDAFQGGKIIITAADSTNFVKVGGTTYTGPATVTVNQETEVEMFVGVTYLFGTIFREGKNFTWTVDGSTHTYKTSKEFTNALFTARIGHTYTIDAVNKTISVVKPSDWDGVIYEGDYLYAPIHRIDEVPSRTKTDLAGHSCLYLKTDNTLIIGPVDVTNFNSITISAGFDNEYDGELMVGLHTKVTGSVDGGFYKSYETTASPISLSGITGNIWIGVQNGYYESYGLLRSIKLNK